MLPLGVRDPADQVLGSAQELLGAVYLLPTYFRAYGASGTVVPAVTQLLCFQQITVELYRNLAFLSVTLAEGCDDRGVLEKDSSSRRASAT